MWLASHRVTPLAYTVEGQGKFSFYFKISYTKTVGSVAEMTLEIKLLNWFVFYDRFLASMILQGYRHGAVTV